jgi:hypothetical protein
VVLWDIRTQEAVGSIPSVSSSRTAAAGGRSSCSSSSSSSGLSCVGVQLDDWRLVTGFSTAGGSSGGCSSGGGAVGGAAGSSSNAAWWQGGGDGYDQQQQEGSLWGSGHSLQVYDIRAAASFSTAAAGAKGADAAAAAGAASSSSGGSRGLWTAAPVMSLPVPNRITCFQVSWSHVRLDCHLTVAALSFSHIQAAT